MSFKFVETLSAAVTRFSQVELLFELESWGWSSYGG
jgi:hypothetical protein